MPTAKQPKIFASITVAGKRIDLCRLTLNARLSQETNAYAADLWVNGDLFCRAENAGRGGPDNYHPVKPYTYEDIRALSSFCKQNIPAIEYHGATLDNDLEMVVGDLITDWQVGKTLDRLLNTNFPIIDPGQNKVLSYRGKFPPGPQRDRLRTQVLRDLPKAIILVDLPREEALILFKKATAA